ncbi:PadR family transcriptional regulator AphA [Arthrobacter bambusae]|uniref:PadR family transcriptional regulator AphA n=1 Tax=Arthrobacter bambusae TaxID=1338426 RepID=A0ABV2P1K2_9MICC
MSLRYALLALLSVEPMTGYDLQKEFQSSVGHVWHAPDSQIYPELRRMEKDGLLEGEDVIWGQKGTKRLYHVTPGGKKALRTWANTTMEYTRTRDPAHLKAAYLELAEPAAARDQMREHVRHHTEQLEQWQDKLRELQSGTSAMLNRRLAATPEADRRRTTEFKIFAYEGLIARAQTEIEWAQRGMSLIDALDKPS